MPQRKPTTPAEESERELERRRAASERKKTEMIELAQREINRRRKERGEEPQRFEDHWTNYINRGIAETLGAPFDISQSIWNALTGGERPSILGREQLIKGGRAIGLPIARGEAEGGRPAEGVLEEGAAGLGRAAGGLIPIAKVMQGLSALRGMGGVLGEALYRPFITAPVRAVAGELGAGAGAGAGAPAAEDLGYSRETGQLVGGMLGGFAPGVAGLAPRAVGARTLPRVIGKGYTKAKSLLSDKKAREALKALDAEEKEIHLLVKERILPDNEARIRLRDIETKRMEIATAETLDARGAQSVEEIVGGATGERVARQIQEVVPDPKKAAQLMHERRASELSPAQRTGEEGLMKMEQKIARRTPEAKESYQKKLAESKKRLREESEEWIRPNQLDDLVQAAQQKSRKQIESLAPAQRQSQSSQIYSENLDDAFDTAKAQNDLNWEQVPEWVRVTTTNARQAYQRLIPPRGQSKDMPTEAAQLLGRQKVTAPEDALVLDQFGKTVIGKDASSRFADTETIREVHGLYSKMREVARQSYFAGNSNRGRISNEIADALWKDLQAPTDVRTAAVGEILEEARRYTREFNKVFRSESVNKLLKRNRSGERIISKEAALEKVLGTKAGAKGRDVIADLRKAVEFEGRAGKPAEKAIEDYLRDRFIKSAVEETGTMSSKKVATFLRENNEILERFPTFKREILDAQRLQKEAVQLRDMVSNFDQAMKTRNPARVVQEMIRDVGPQNKEALKQAFVEFGMKGKTVRSGTQLLEILDDPIKGKGAAELFGKDINKLRRFAEELATVERLELQGLGPEQIFSGLPGEGATFLAGTLGTKAASMLNQMMGGFGAGSIRFASKTARAFERQVIDNFQGKTSKIIIAAFDDPELLEAMLDTPLSGTGPKSWKKIMAWFKNELKDATSVAPWMTGAASEALPEGAQEIIPEPQEEQQFQQQ